MSDTDGSDESDLVLEYFSSDGDHVFQGEGDEAGSGAEEEDHVHGIQFGLYEPIAALNKLKTGLMRNQIMYELTKIGFLIQIGELQTRSRCLTFSPENSLYLTLDLRCRLTFSLVKN